jgi:aminoglycoside/choline kinase family phosphotransferase
MDGNATPPGLWVREQNLAGDASSRRYSRLWDRAGLTSVLVRYPSNERDQLIRDLEVRSWCAAQGLRVPALTDLDVEAGWAVLEDFGEDDAEQVLLATPPEKQPNLALDLIGPLVTIARLTPADLPRWNPPLDRHRLRWELTGFELWFLRHRLGMAPSATISHWLDDLAARIDGHPKRVCHRDFHLNNLFVLDSGEVGLIDYQDILVGPECYDAVSLLEDRAMPELIGARDREAIRTRWAASTSARTGWQDRWSVVRLQRGLKVLGTFARLSASGKTSYEPWLSRLAHELASDLVGVSAPDELAGCLLD